MHDQFYYDTLDFLLDIANTNQIIINNSLDLGIDTPDVCFATSRGIAMNPNWNSNVSYLFRLSHELCHIIYGDSECQRVYMFSEHGRRFEERLAHYRAIEMLMSFKTPSSTKAFMEYYSIPYWLEEMVAIELNKQLN